MDTRLKRSSRKETAGGFVGSGEMAIQAVRCIQAPALPFNPPANRLPPVLTRAPGSTLAQVGTM